MLVENEVAHIVGARGYERYGVDEEMIRGIPIPVNQAPNLQWIIAKRRPYIVQNTASENFKWVNKELEGHVLSFITAPIFLGDMVIGFINLDSPEENAFSNEDARRLSAFASHAAVAIQNARLYSQIQEYAGDLERRVAQRTLELNEANTLLMEQIRQREEAESQLHAERNLLRAVMDTIPDAIYVKDRQSRFIVVNQATVGRLDEETRRNIQGKSDFDFFPPEFASTLYETEQKVMETGEAVINHSEVFRDSRGQLVHLLVSKLPMRNDNGEVIGIIGVNHNISDLRAAEAALDQVIRSARCILWSATVTRDDNDEYTWQFSIANESAASGFLPLDTTSRSYSDAWLASIQENDRKKRDQALRTYLNFKRHEFSHEFRVQLPDQSMRWLAEDVQVQEISKGRWYLAGVCTDITARKQIEERLQKLNEELELRVANRTHELIRINTALRQEIVERRRAEESERTQRLLAEALRDSVAKVNSTLDLEAVFATLMEVIQAVVPYDSADIMLLEDQTHGRIRHHTGYQIPISTELRDISGWSDKMSAYHSGEVFIIHDTLEFPDYQDSDSLGWVRSNITVPIKLENNIIGFLTLNSKKSSYFTQEQADWLQVFAIQAGIAIRNAHMVQEIRHYTQQLESLVEKRTHELQVGRAQLKAILDAMREGVYYGELNAPPQFINRALVEMTQFSPEEWLDGKAQATVNNDPETIHQVTTWDEVHKTLTRQGYWRSEAIIRRKDGSSLQIELVRTEVRREDGQREGVVTVMRDISQEKALQEQKARFIAIAAHELRTPIANLKTRLFLLKRQPERFSDHAEIATQVINWMQRLVEDMFDLARFERGIMKLAREEFDIREMVEQIIIYQQPEAERQEIQIELNMPSVEIYADPYRMMQVFTNLLRNALQYTPQNGRIEINGKIEEDVLMIQVQDTGQGISEENLPYLFQPFFRASEDNKGAGLGLSITQEIVEAHGGSISAHSVLGEGSTFSIRLPLEHIRNSGDQ
jgi:PAS domain S-box-containing protein